MTTEKLLHEEIVNGFTNLNELEVGTEKREKAVNELTKLVDRAIEIDKLNIEHEEKVKNREIEIDFRNRQMAEERKDRIVRNSIAAAGIVIPSLITIWGTVKSLRFEQEGTVTTIMGRGFINKLLPKK